MYSTKENKKIKVFEIKITLEVFLSLGGKRKRLGKEKGW